MMNSKKDFKIDFIGIGAPKSGTSWISQCLAEHSEIGLMDGNVVRFFSNEKYYTQGMGFYSTLFSGAAGKKIIGEFNPGYIEKDGVADRIYKMCPDVKIIACLRNPVDRAYSHYNYQKIRYLLIGRNIEEAIKYDRQLIIEPGFYYKNLKRYFELFPRENILILLFDDIKKDPQKLMSKVYGFIGANSSFVPPSLKTKIRVTSTELYPWARVNSLKTFAIRFSQKNRAFKSLVGIFKRTRLLNLIGRAIGFVSTRKSIIANIQGVDKRPIEKKEREILRNIYKEDISSLEKLLDKDLTLWR